MGTAKLKNKESSRVGKTRNRPVAATVTRETKSWLSPTQVADASAILKILSDPIRLKVLLVLSDGERSVEALSNAFGQTRAVVSHHLALLRSRGLITSRRQGKENWFSLAEEGRRIVDVFEGSLLKGSSGKNSPMSVESTLLKDVGGFVDDPMEWFQTPNEAFDGRKPIDLLGTPDEPRLRNRIEAAKLGMFS